ncbi:putative Arc-like DNA binding domain protein [Streptomyces phage Dagobah]|nr:putative Arc-like DNA binding domain protein [Streptomyces phage Dagobah]
MERTVSVAEHEALSALNMVGKRVKVHDEQLVLKVPAPVKKLVVDHAEAQGVSNATIIRFALAEYFERRGIA